MEERETPRLIPKEMKLIKQIVSTAAPPLPRMDGGSAPVQGQSGRRDPGSPPRHLPLSLSLSLSSKSLERVCRQLRGEVEFRVAVKSVKLRPPFIFTSRIGARATQLRALSTLAPKVKDRNWGIVNRHHAKKQGVLKRFTRRLARSFACPKTRTNVLDIEEREREAKPRGRGEQ